MCLHQRLPKFVVSLGERAEQPVIWQVTYIPFSGSVGPGIESFRPTKGCMCSVGTPEVRLK